jgi:hypothetical protein
LKNNRQRVAKREIASVFCGKMRMFVKCASSILALLLPKLVQETGEQE